MYELAVWIKMFHMTFSPSHNRGKVVQLEYKQQQSCKFNYNYLYSFKPIATHWSLLNYLKYFKEVYELAVLTKNVPYNFLSIPQPWEICTASVQATAKLQIYLYLPPHYSHTVIFN